MAGAAPRVVAEEVHQARARAATASVVAGGRGLRLGRETLAEGERDADNAPRARQSLLDADVTDFTLDALRSAGTAAEHVFRRGGVTARFVVRRAAQL